MSFTKKTYVDGETVITAGDLNGMQDELIRLAGVAGTPGASGEDGGYYTPSVTQPMLNVMQIRFSGSKPSMPSVANATVNLPRGPQGEQGEQGPQGPKGDTYELTAADKTEIANIAAQQVADTTYTKQEIDSKLGEYTTPAVVNDMIADALNAIGEAEQGAF